METKEQDVIIEKVRKLLAKAEDASVTQIEAAAFAAKAQELMQAYNLSRNDLQEKPLIRIQQITLGSTRKWHKHLINGIAGTNFCKVAWSTRTTGAWIFGEEHNIAFVLELYRFLWREAERLATAEYLSYVAHVWPVIPAQTWKTNFYRGFCDAVWRRLHQQFVAAQAGTSLEARPEDEKASQAVGVIAAPDGNKMRALVVVQNAALDEKVKEALPETKEARKNYFASQKETPDAGYKQGVRVGQTIPLHKQIAGK